MVQRAAYNAAATSADQYSPHVERLFREQGLKLTSQRRVIARVLSSSSDHPDAETLHSRVLAVDQSVSLATIYRTLKLLEEAGIANRHDFGDGRGRYELAYRSHHDHLIDIATGEVIEFQNEMIERIQNEVARQLGYELVDHRLELFGKKL